ncbi:hypothetical protein VPH35_105617 [Triticum aestivum]
MAMKNATQQVVRALESSLTRSLHASPGSKKIVGVFYKGGEYAGQNPNFVGCVENALGIRSWLESQGHQYIVTDDKDGPNCELEKHIADAHVLITTPFHPAYVSADRIRRGKNLELLLTAGIGSDHIELPAAAAAGLTVAEVTGSNTVSVAEDQLMRILVLMRNFLPGHHQAISGEWTSPASRTGPTTWRARRWAPSAPAASGSCCSSASSPSAATCSTTTGSASTPRSRRSSAPPSRRTSTPCCPSATSSCSTCRSPRRQSK